MTELQEHDDNATINETETDNENVLVERNGEFLVGNDNRNEKFENEGSNGGQTREPDAQSESELREYADENEVIQNEGVNGDAIPEELSTTEHQNVDTYAESRTGKTEKTVKNRSEKSSAISSPTTISFKSEKSRTLEMIEDARKEHARKMKRQRDAARKQQEELQAKEKESRAIFDEWCRQKDQEAREKRKKDRQQREKLYEEINKDDKEERARASFHEWVREKERQSERDKLMLQYKRQEEQMAQFTRTQEDSDIAFKKWLKQKKRQEEEQVKSMRQRTRRTEKMRQKWERYNYRSFFDNTPL